VIRAVLDANVLVSALLNPAGPPGLIVKALVHSRAFELITSTAILVELRRSLGYPRVRRSLSATDDELDLWVAALGLIADPAEGGRTIRGVLKDPDDEKYLSAAIEGRAQFIVSGDAHLLDLGAFEGVRIVNPRAFLRAIGESRS
jgi:hypothetical protein